ncbi:MAG: lytic murein transglycosylase, partial [Marivita lacus]|nr:lytic murein transglycosylase [Marivita lacus]
MRIRVIASILAMMSGPALAETPDGTTRPVSRSLPEPVVSRNAVSLVSVVAPQMSLRPALRPAVSPVSETRVAAATQLGFADWINDFRTRAVQQGISGDVFDRAFVGATYDADVIRRDRNQSEFTKTIWDYLDSAASDARVSNGKAALQKHAALLDQIETRYGVDKDVVVAVWGLESAYGTFRGTNPVIGSLATLAYDARRSAFFEGQLIEALKILQSGDVTLADFT